MLRSLFSGISGLRAHQQMMDVTGNNIANVNTTGYKSSQTVFQDTLSQMVNPAGPPQNGAGGTNPAQVGLGVRTASINANFSQGAAQTTGGVDHLRERVLEDRLARLVTGGVDVGDVVAGDVHHLLVRAQAADAGEERTQHRSVVLRGSGIIGG